MIRYFLPGTETRKELTVLLKLHVYLLRYSKCIKRRVKSQITLHSQLLPSIKPPAGKKKNSTGIPGPSLTVIVLWHATLFIYFKTMMQVIAYRYKKWGWRSEISSFFNSLLKPEPARVLEFYFLDNKTPRVLGNYFIFAKIPQFLFFFLTFYPVNPFILLLLLSWKKKRMKKKKKTFSFDQSFIIDYRHCCLLPIKLPPDFIL